LALSAPKEIEVEEETGIGRACGTGGVMSRQLKHRQ
jgi:hypothetical protein